MRIEKFGKQLINYQFYCYSSDRQILMKFGIKIATCLI